jgi:hypothetical protein
VDVVEVPIRGDPPRGRVFRVAIAVVAPTLFTAIEAIPWPFAMGITLYSPVISGN